jgi:hypothetical protein
LSWWALLLRISIREVLRKLLVGLELRVKLAYAQLVIMRYFDLIDLSFLEQLFFTTEHILEKILVHGRLVWKIVL